MNIETRKLSFIQEFLRIQNEEVVIKLEKLLYKQKSELTQKDINPMSFEKFNSDINQSLEDANNGRLISANDLKNKFQKWS